MSNLSFFEFESKQVRTTTISGEIAFCLTDVLVAMNSTTTVTAVKAVVSEGLGDEYVINILIQDSLGRDQDTVFILEAGLTFLLARSRTSIGKQLNRLIHTEILPSLRKTGKYEVDKVQSANIERPSSGLIAAREVSEIEALLAHNPRLAQLCIDDAMNRVVVNFWVGEPSSGASTTIGRGAMAQSVLRGVNEIALEMGYRTDSSSRVKLGNFIKTQGFVSTKEKRICNGVMTDINCYADTAKLREAIAQFFS